MAEQLDVLTCTQCAAPIPFGDAATSTCPFCQTVNQVPAAFHEMRAWKQLDATTRAEAERLLRTLDRPASIVTKVIARMFDFNFLVFMFAYGIPFALWIIIGGLRFASWIAPRLGYKTGDDVPMWIMCTFMFSIVFVVIFVPRTLGIYANRRMTARMRVLAALAASPPKTQGGPSLCRHCGSPLFIESGSLLAVCAYCGTENAVQLRTQLVVAAGKAAQHLAATVQAAAATDRKERARTRGHVLRDLVWYLAFVALFDVAFSFGDVPGWGTALTVVAALTLIALPFLSGFRREREDRRDSADGTDEAALRRQGNDVPGWVAVLGPLIVWVVFHYAPL